MLLEVFRRTTDHPAIGAKLHRHVVRVGHPSNANAQVVPLTHKVDEAIGQVEGQLQIRKFLMEPKRMWSDM
ncbi:hypothetical protein D3C76_1853680 [compost metagenome]